MGVENKLADVEASKVLLNNQLVEVEASRSDLTNQPTDVKTSNADLTKQLGVVKAANTEVEKNLQSSAGEKEKKLSELTKKVEEASLEKKALEKERDALTV